MDGLIPDCMRMPARWTCWIPFMARAVYSHTTLNAIQYHITTGSSAILTKMFETRLYLQTGFFFFFKSKSTLIQLWQKLDGGFRVVLGRKKSSSPSSNKYGRSLKKRRQEKSLNISVRYCKYNVNDLFLFLFVEVSHLA